MFPMATVFPVSGNTVQLGTIMSAVSSTLAAAQRLLADSLARGWTVNRLDKSRFERGQAQPTAVFNLVAPDERSAFQLVQVIENPFPRDIESWLRSLEFMRDHPYLLVSRFLSRTSRSLLEEAGVNAGRKLSSSRRLNLEHPYPRSSAASTSLPLPLSR